MGHLEQKQFVGSMAFNRFIQASPSPSPASTATPPEAQLAAAGTADPPNGNVDGNADVDGGGTGPPCRTITITSDNNSADEDSGEIRSVPASLGDKHNEHSNDFTGGGEDEDDEDMYLVEDHSYIPGGGGVFEEAKEVALNVLRRDSIVGNIAMAQSFVLDAEGHRRGAMVGEMERSGTTVTATTDVRIAMRCVGCCLERA